MYCVLTARTAAIQFFQNSAHDRESNPHAILIRIWFFLAIWNCKNGADEIREYTVLLILRMCLYSCVSSMRSACAILSSVFCPAVHYFPDLINGTIFRGKKCYWTKNVCFDFLCSFCRKYFSFWEEFSKMLSRMYVDIYVNLLAPELFFLILAHPVYKMWIIQEPNTLELWKKVHFEERKTESIYHF